MVVSTAVEAEEVSTAVEVEEVSTAVAAANQGITKQCRNRVGKNYVVCIRRNSELSSWQQGFVVLLPAAFRPRIVTHVLPRVVPRVQQVRKVVKVPREQTAPRDPRASRLPHPG